MKDWSDSETIGTRTYLKMGHSMLQSFTEKDLTVRERAKLAWAPVTFLRYWTVWLQISGRYKTQVTGHRSQVTGHRAQVTGHRSQVTGHRAQVIGHRKQLRHSIRLFCFISGYATIRHMLAIDHAFRFCTESRTSKWLKLHIVLELEEFLLWRSRNEAFSSLHASGLGTRL